MTEVETAIAEIQPELTVIERDPAIKVAGLFTLSDAKGPFDAYDVEIRVFYGYPLREPKVFERGGRIPKLIDRHVNKGDGSCCITVWEHWLAVYDDNSFAAFLACPMREYFLAQTLYKSPGEWTFGEREHFGKGLLEAYAEALSVVEDPAEIELYLQALTKERPKPNKLCPCGSGLLLKDCHYQKVVSLHRKISSCVSEANETSSGRTYTFLTNA